MTPKNEIDVTIINGETIASGIPSGTWIRAVDGSIVNGEYESWSSQKFNYVFADGDVFVHEQNVVKSVNYTVKDGQSPKLKFEISEETYEKLPETLKRLYEKNVTNEQEEFVVEGTVTVNDIDAYTKSTPNLVVYSKNDVINTLHTFNFRGDNKQAMVNGTPITTYREGSIEVTFFEKAWDGKMRKVFAKKQNGQSYADGRGRMVNDYPLVIDKIIIPAHAIPEFSANGQEAMNRKMQSYFDHVTMSHMLND